MDSANKKFRFRRFTSFTILFAFLVVAYSGVVMYFRPEGSIARWVGWSYLGMDKKGWESIHTLSIIVFLVFVIIHLFYNWKVLLYNLIRRKGQVSGAKEFITAFIVVGFVVISAILRLNPLWKVIDVRNSIKQGIYVIKVQPPVLDADEKTITEISAILNIHLDEMLKIITEKGYLCSDTSAKLGNVAKQNKVSPEQLFGDMTNK